MTEPMQDVAPDKQVIFREIAVNIALAVAVRLFAANLVNSSTLCDQLAISSDLLEAALVLLRGLGCEVHVANDKIKMLRLGFPLMSALLTLMLNKVGIDIDVKTFQETQSTNDECFAAAAKGANKPLAVIANVQTKGRGRRGNRWEAKPGQSALLSLLLPGRELPVETLSLAAGLAVAESIAMLTRRSPELKWPNDVLIDDRKIAGILIETRPNVKNPDLTDYVIGVGVNVMQTHKDFPPDLAGRAISLGMIHRRDWQITYVIMTLLADLQNRCNPLASGDEIVPLWRARCRMLGQNIRVSCAGSVLEGTVADIDPMEGLIVRDPHGINHACLASQTTVFSQYMSV